MQKTVLTKVQNTLQIREDGIRMAVGHKTGASKDLQGSYYGGISQLESTESYGEIYHYMPLQLLSTIILDLLHYYSGPAVVPSFSFGPSFTVPPESLSI